MFYDVYISLCKRDGKKPSPVAVELGLRTSNVAQWKKGSTPRPEVLKKVATYFNVPISYLLGATDDPNDRSKTHWAEIVDFDECEHTKNAPAVSGGGKQKLRSVSRLESADISPEMDKSIADYIDFLLKKGDK